MFDVVAKECARMGANQVLILGTAVTMRSPRFRHKFAEHGIDATGPEDETVRSLTAQLISELQLGHSEGAAQRLDTIARTACQQQFSATPLVCLACTELPLAFPEMKSRSTFESGGIRYLNSTIVHVDALLKTAGAQPS